MLVGMLPQRVRHWAAIAGELGFDDFTSAEDGFRTILKSGEPWRPDPACGIYFWIANDGETYVGKSVNVPSRLRQHSRDHQDLSFASFRPVPRAQLAARETELIQRVCRTKLRTRNIKEALQTQAAVPFDRLVSEVDRNAFLSGRDLADVSWRELALLEQKHARRFDRLTQETDFHQILRALGLFIERVIPRPAATEARFWSVSLFVQCHILRVNAGQQEVFTIQRASDARLYTRPLSTTPFGPESNGPMYRTSSYDAWVPVEELSNWLVGERLLACRELVIRLMRHTTPLNSGSHCPQVVRAAMP